MAACYSLIPSWLSVDKAIIFKMSCSCIALIPAARVVKMPLIINWHASIMITAPCVRTAPARSV